MTYKAYVKKFSAAFSKDKNFQIILSLFDVHWIVGEQMLQTYLKTDLASVLV